MFLRYYMFRRPLKLISAYNCTLFNKIAKAAAIMVHLSHIRVCERAFIKCEVPTSDASDVIADVFLESVCIGLLEVEILEMLFEDLIGRLVGFAQIL